MICIAITAVAFGTISRSLPIGSIAYVAEVNAKCERLIWLERRWARSRSAPCAAPAGATAT